MERNYCTIRGLAIIGSYPNGTKELNMIKFDNKPPKYDLRVWKEDAAGNRTMGKGVTMTVEEAKRLYIELDQEFGSKVAMNELTVLDALHTLAHNGKFAFTLRELYRVIAKLQRDDNPPPDVQAKIETAIETLVNTLYA